jgi:hypothetical protein
MEDIRMGRDTSRFRQKEMNEKERGKLTQSESVTENPKIIIPLYKLTFNIYEKRSLEQCLNILSCYKVIFVKPVSIDISKLRRMYPQTEEVSFDDNFFMGIEGYNRLMLSEVFYRRFLDTKYILIYQLDAYTFRDELAEWCEKGYDYIGAPWLRRPIYEKPIISSIMSRIGKYHEKKGQLHKQMLYDKVGNGGFSLRKVESHYEAARQYKTRINFLLSQPRSHLYNEDVFWATVPWFKYPDSMEALQFAFDKYPDYCYKLTSGRLPFGCHSWYKRKMKRFWKPIIGF